MDVDFRTVSIGLAIAVIWSIYLVLVKLSVMYNSDVKTQIFFLGLGVFFVFLVYAAYNRPTFVIDGPVMISMLSGIFWAIGLLILFNSLHLGLEIAKLSPLIGLSILFVSLMGVFMLNEAPTDWYQVIVGASLITLGMYILI